MFITRHRINKVKEIGVKRSISSVLRKAANYIDPDCSINKLWLEIPFKLQIEDLDNYSYDNVKHIREAEHQLGRLLNMKYIFEDMNKNCVSGDIIEFGCWQGMSLIWLAKYREFVGGCKYKLVGVDSFEGLPEDSTVWKKGMFSNTSRERLKENIEVYLNKTQKKNIHIIQGWFSDEKVKKKINEIVEEPVLFHLDSDLRSSTEAALSIISPYINNNKISYLLFDDWGCHPNEVPDAFFMWIHSNKHLQPEVMCTTNMTRYYKITNESI